MKKIILILFLIYINIFSSNLENTKTIKLNKSIINDNYIEIEKLESTKNIIVLQKKDIEENGYSSVSQILNDVPGITVGTSGWGEIDLRGQGEQASKNIQVLVDGAPITALINHPFTMNYDVVPVEQIEKIEIIPGGGSVLYGNGTSGGVINITTNLKSMDKPINKVGYEFSVDKEKKYYINLGRKINDNLNIQLNYSDSKKDWYFVDTYTNSRYFSSGFHYKISDDQAFTFKYSNLNESGQFIKTITKDNLKKYGHNYKPPYSNTTVGVDKNGLKIVKRKRKYLSNDREENNFKGTYSINLTDDINLYIDGFKIKGYFTNNDDDDTKLYYDTLGSKAKLNINYGEKNSILFGLDYFQQKASLKYNDYRMRKISDGDRPVNGQTVSGNYIKYNGKYTYKEVPLTFNYTKLTKAIYFLNIHKINSFEFTQGARYDITDWSFDKNAADGKGKEKSHRINKNYEISTAYNYRDTGKIFIRYERSFTGPDGQQISDRIIDSNGNKIYVKTDAKDEIFNIYEIGLRDYFMGSAVNLTGFYTKTDNQMNRVYINGIKESRTVNYLATERHGFEFSANQILGKLSLEESYTYLKGKSRYNNKGKKAIADGKKIDWSNSGLQKVPKHMISLKANYSLTDNLLAGITWKYTGSYNNFYSETKREDDDVVKSHTLVDLSIKYNNPNGLSLYTGINNIFNETYYGYTTAGQYGSVVPEFGRTFYAGISYTF